MPPSDSSPPSDAAAASASPTGGAPFGVALSDALLAAIGRMTVAATDLEHYLAWIGADRAGGDAGAVFAAGEAYEAARGSVEFAAPAVCRGRLAAFAAEHMDHSRRSKVVSHVDG